MFSADDIHSGGIFFLLLLACGGHGVCCWRLDLGAVGVRDALKLMLVHEMIFIGSSLEFCPGFCCSGCGGNGVVVYEPGLNSVHGAMRLFTGLNSQTWAVV